jgi:hypothetical protein
MALYHCSTKLISRSTGRSAVAAAAYRSATRLEDTRTGLSHDYTQKQGVMQAYTLLPSGQSVERVVLWNAAEQAEKRKDARTAREWIVALPSELVPRSERERELITGSPDFELVEQFAKALSRRYQVAVDVAIHAPSKAGDQRNYHAHILTTTRQVQEHPTGAWALSQKATLELSDSDRRKQGLGNGAEEIKAVRELWEVLANAKLEQEQKSARIDSRSFKTRGIDQVSTVHMGQQATQMERTHRPSERGHLNRAIEQANRQRRQLSADIIDLQRERARRVEVVAQPRPVTPKAPDTLSPEHIKTTYLHLLQREIQQVIEKAQPLYQRAKTKFAQGSNAWHSTPPDKPTGLLAILKQSKYEKEYAAWQQVKEKGGRMMDIYRVREEQLKNATYSNIDNPHSIHPTLADRIGRKRLERAQPDLCKQYDEVKRQEQQKRQEQERLKQEREPKHRNRASDKGWSR